MVILSGISLVGFVCALIIHILAATKMISVGSHLEVFIAIEFIFGCVLSLVTLIKSWDWSFSGLLENYFDEMPGTLKSLVGLMFVYPFIIGTISHYRSMPFGTMSDSMFVFAMTSTLLPLFFLPACYFWKERPQ